MESRIISAYDEYVERLEYAGANLIEFRGDELEVCAEAGYLAKSGYFLGRFLADSLVAVYNLRDMKPGEDRETTAVEAMRATLAFIEGDDSAEYWLGAFVVDGLLLNPVRVLAGNTGSCARLARIVARAFDEFSYDDDEWTLLHAATTHKSE